MTSTTTIQVSAAGHVATVLLRRPPHNFVDLASMTELSDTLQALDAGDNCRSIVLGSEGKSFCAGANFTAVPGGGPVLDSAALYAQAVRLFRTRKPIIAALQGSAIGAGAGLALVAVFGIACPASRFSVNFNRLGVHPGFGLSCTLPRLVAAQVATKFTVGSSLGGFWI